VLLPAAVRVSGQRRYPPSAIGRVGEILLLRAAGYTLRELTALLAAHAGDGRPELAPQGELTGLDHRIVQTQAART
jgi:DNA-binding transcriptional MerR regulator